MLRLFFLILSISLMAMVVFPNGVYAMENNHKMDCCEKNKSHNDCCKKKDAKHQSSEKKDTNKGCNQKSNACLCIGFLSTMVMKNQYVDFNQNAIALPQKYMLTNDKKPSLVYLDLWLLPKING